MPAALDKRGKNPYNDLMNIADIVRTKLLRAHKTVAVAESCTGGALAKALTDKAGSSAYFIAGMVTYSNQAKTRLLGVPPGTLRLYGAVSPQVACAMAKNIRKTCHTDFGIGITGIAGPDGGTREKPVGTVYVALAAKNTLTCKKLKLKGTRARIRAQAAAGALALLARRLSCAPLSP